MDIQNLVPVDYSNQRVLLTAQVAEVFNTTTERISHNFSENKQRFNEDAHYFKLTGAALRSFKKSCRNPPFSKMANCLFLWTELGTARHCQMLKDPNALEIMEQLRAAYFIQKPVMTPQVFNHPQFGNLRAVLIDGEPFFIGKDVASALGYKDTDQALRQHVPDKFKRVITAQQMASNQETVKSTGIFSQEAMGGVQRLVVISEAGLYRLIMRSRLPDAEKFSDWVCGEVLPAINKHGFYSTKPVETSLFPDEEPVKKVRRAPTPELAVVYAALLSNMLVKIGYTKNLTDRLKDLQKETKADILKWAASAVMTRDEAILLERALKVKFFPHIVTGELFNVDFDAVKAALAHDDKFDKLLALAEKVNSPDEKDKLLIRAANLI